MFEAIDSVSHEPASVRVAVAFRSGYGHTARQAEAVADGAREVAGTTVELLAVDELTDSLWSSLDAADAIVFGAPTYMGSPSAGFKAFAEGTSAVQDRGGVHQQRTGQLSRLSLRQPPARLLAMICLNMAVRAGALMGSSSRKATVRAVLLPWPPVMMPSGSGTMAPS